MRNEPPVWRSMLFVPANVERFVQQAHTRNADAYILDLEDAVAPSEKANAREKVSDAAATIASNGCDVLVRINRPWRMAVRDMERAVGKNVTALVLPKVADASHLRATAEVVAELEREIGLPLGHTKLVPMIETVAALPESRAIAAADPRVAAIVLGGEDFSASAGISPEAEALHGPNQEVLMAAHASGCLGLGVVGSIAEFNDLGKFRSSVERARRLGAQGSFCIHPAQVAVLNEVFSPPPEVVSAAKALVGSYDKAIAEGSGAIVHEGKMIDVPVAERARELVARAERIASMPK